MKKTKIVTLVLMAGLASPALFAHGGQGLTPSEIRAASIST